jgi:hypothetical protein
MSATIGDEELDAAVAEGVLTSETASRLRDFVERRRAAPAADEEQFRLLTGFNDIFVSIALLLVLIALAWLGGRIVQWLGAALVAAACWGLAEFFTARRRMALPSILLLLGWVGGVSAVSLLTISGATQLEPGGPRLALSALAAGVAAYAHWLRFKVPITVAAGTGAVLGLLIIIASTTIPGGFRLILPLIFLSGLCLFGLALWWDMSDPGRRTRRADVAFWLHLSAAPLLVHPVFSWLGLASAPWEGATAPPAGAIDFSRPALAVAIYLLLALVALIIDRRALMVSALAYVLYAMNAFFRGTGDLTISLALSALIAGAALLLLSAYWRPARRGILALAPARLRARLPPA